jgi:hypothetical protein
MRFNRFSDSRIGRLIGNNKGIALVVAVALLALVAAATLIIMLNSRNTQDATTGATTAISKTSVCSSQLLTRASVEIHANNSLNLGSIVEEIDKLDNYQRDPNCLYVKLQYNFINNISAGNSDLITKLSAVGADNYSFGTELGPYIMTMDDIAKRAKDLQTINDQYQKSQAENQARMKEELQYVESH